MQRRVDDDEKVFNRRMEVFRGRYESCGGLIAGHIEALPSSHMSGQSGQNILPSRAMSHCPEPPRSTMDLVPVMEKRKMLVRVPPLASPDLVTERIVQELLALYDLL